jgi:hypothetical protein
MQETAPPSVILIGGSGYETVYEATAGTFSGGSGRTSGTGCGGSRAYVTDGASTPITFTPPADGVYTIRAVYANAHGAVSVADEMVMGAAAGGCPEDVDGSGNVDVNDLLSMLSAFGSAGAAGEDVNGDGLVNVNDLLQLLGQFGAICESAPVPVACTGCCPVGAACFAPDPPCCALRPVDPLPPVLVQCTLGEDCGGQVWNDCGTMCPATCGVPMGMCNMMCNAAYQCANGESWDPSLMTCVDPSACSDGGGELPPGMAAGRPFLTAKAAPTYAHAVEQAVSDWIGMAGPDGKHNHDGRHGGDYGQEEEL